MKLNKWGDALLIGCGAAKLDHPARAADLYTSTYFQAKVRFAEGLGLPWAILSGKLGIVQPDSLTHPYDLNAESLSEYERREWQAGVALQLFEWQREVKRLLVIAGDSYFQPLANVLRPLEVEAFNPCLKLGMGDQMKFMKECPSPDCIFVLSRLFVRRHNGWYDQWGEDITNPARIAMMDEKLAAETKVAA